MTEPSMPVSPADDSEDLPQNSDDSIGSPFVSVLGFNGERRSDLLGGYHLGNGYRLYNPELRRFNSPDNMSPFGKGGINPYAYCEGDPINNIDPTGHFGFWAFFRSLFDCGERAVVEDQPEALVARGVEQVALEEMGGGAPLHGLVERELRPLNPSMGFLHLSGASISHNDRGMLARVDNSIRASYLSRRLPPQYDNGLVQGMMVRVEGGPTVFDALMSNDGFRKVGHVGGVGGHDIYQTIGYGPSIHTEEELNDHIYQLVPRLNRWNDALLAANQNIAYKNNPNEFLGMQDEFREAVEGKSLQDLEHERNIIQTQYNKLKHLQGRAFYEAGDLTAENLLERFPL